MAWPDHLDSPPSLKESNNQNGKSRTHQQFDVVGEERDPQRGKHDVDARTGADRLLQSDLVGGERGVWRGGRRRISKYTIMKMRLKTLVSRITKQMRPVLSTLKRCFCCCVA
jgi:hypothetical protein